jgi:hypothetical protein
MGRMAGGEIKGVSWVDSFCIAFVGVVVGLDRLVHYQ